jgi:hypothetical protein
MSTAARLYQDLGRWAQAAAAWDAVGNTSMADTCRRIDVAIQRGDSFRARVKHLQDSGVPRETALKQATLEIYP